MNVKKRIAIVAAAVAAVFAVTLLVTSILYSERVDSITVTFVGPGDEVRDQVILGIGKEEADPDYRLDVVYTGGKYKCGTVLNRSAAGGITFAVAEDIGVSQIQELVLIEDDKLRNDTIARVQWSAKTVSADGYRFEVATSRNFKVGLNWLFSTALGKAISLGITLGVALVIVMMFK